MIGVAIWSKAEWHEYNGHAYRYSNTALSWKDGRFSCEEQGAYLVNINDEDENDFLVSTYTGSNNNQYWIGLYPFCYELGHDTNCWSWTENEDTSITYSNWDKTSYPSSSTEKTSVLINFKSDDDGEWRNIKEENVKGYICEREDPCSSQPCQNGGICQVIDPLTYECDCGGTGYEGRNCETDINECKDQTDECQNGLCKNIPGGL